MRVESIEHRIENVVISARIWSDDLVPEDKADFYGELAETFRLQEVALRVEMADE